MIDSENIRANWHCNSSNCKLS